MNDPNTTKEEHLKELQENEYSCIEPNDEDFPENIKSEDVLFLRESYLSAILENQPGLVWLKDINNRFLTVNTAFANACGLANPKQLIGKTDFDVWPKELATRYVADDLSVILSATPKTIEEPISDQGDIKWFETFKAPITDKQGRVIATTGYSRDITQRKQAEILLKEKNQRIKAQNEDYKRLNEELLKAKEKSEESDRLKTAFLQNMSHEIRTPMNAIVGFSSMLEEPDLSPEELKNYLSIIVNSSNQLLSIVTDIITISSIDTKQMSVNVEKVTINNLMDHLLSIFNNQASNINIELIVKKPLPDESSEIYTDQTKLTQILSNLLSNALKFTPHGCIEFGYQLKTNELEFYVKDDGIGIYPDQHEIIFERFRQADLSTTRKYGGSGLGLSISKGFVELLGGKIWLESEPDKGSTFFFTIPYNTMVNP